MRKFDDMKMPGYYSEMDDSEKGLTGGGVNESDVQKGFGYATMGLGGFAASVGGYIWHHGATGVEAETAALKSCGHGDQSAAEWAKAGCEGDVAAGKMFVGLGAVALVAGATLSIVGACTDDD